MGTGVVDSGLAIDNLPYETADAAYGKLLGLDLDSYTPLFRLVDLIDIALIGSCLLLLCLCEKEKVSFHAGTVLTDSRKD